MLKGLTEKKIVVGFDGFVDTIVRAVDVRDGDNFRPIETISDFGKRIMSAAGKSANIELVQQKRAIGGNGPLMSHALCQLGANVKYIGAIGACENNIFRDFARTTSAVSIGEYSETRAVEFTDGKILFGEMLPLQMVTVDSILSKISRGEIVDIFSHCHGLGVTNWTMMTHLTEIMKFFITDIFPQCAHNDYNNKKVFFFDLADPEKRKPDELLQFLSLLSDIEAFGKSILGLNLREATQVITLLGGPSELEESKEQLLSAAKFIRQKLRIHMVFIHGMKIFVAASAAECVFSEGYYVPSPKLSTGAGDHCNAAFLAAYLCGNPLEHCVHFSAAASAFYVANGMSPKPNDVKLLL